MIIWKKLHVKPQIKLAKSGKLVNQFIYRWKASCCCYCFYWCSSQNGQFIKKQISRGFNGSMPVPRLCCSFIINSIISLQIYQPIWHRQQIKNQCLTCMSNMAMTYIYRVTFREAHCLFIRKSIITCPFCRFLQFIPRKKKSINSIGANEKSFFLKYFLIPEWLRTQICSHWIKWASILMFIYFFLHTSNIQLVSRVRFKCAISGTIITTNYSIKYITLHKKCRRTLRWQMGKFSFLLISTAHSGWSVPSRV